MTPHAGPTHWRKIFGLLAAALATAAFSLISVEKLKNAAVAMVADGPVQPHALLASLGPVDALLGGISLLAVLALVLAEWRGRGLTRLWTEASPRQSWIVLSIILAWLGHSYLFPGVLLGGDTGTHIVRFMEVRRALEAGLVPHWTNDQYLGSPLLGFTGPLTYLVGGALDVLIQDAPTTAKILLFSLHVAVGWAFYAFLQRLGIGRAAALVATLGFAGAFAHLHLFLFRGVFPQAFTILFLVLLFHAAEGLMRGVGSRAGNWLIFAFVTAGLIVNHQPHALFIAFYLGLFCAVSLVLGRWQWRGVWALIGAGVCGAVMSIAAVVPLILESDWVMIQPEGAMFGLHVPSVGRLAQLVLWRNTRTNWGIDYWAYLGLPFILLGAIGLWTGLRRGSRDTRAVVIAVVPCLVLGFFLFNPVVRDVMFLLFFGGILAGLGMGHLLRADAARTWLASAAALLLLLDVASTSIQPVARSDKEFLVAAGQYLARVAPGERIVEIVFDRAGGFSANIGPNAGPISYRAAVPRIAGHHNMAATRVHNYVATIAKRAETELRADGALSGGTRVLLGIFNVSRVVCLGPSVVGCPASFLDGHEDGPLGRVVAIQPMPALFASRLVLRDPPNITDKPMLWDEQFAVAQAPAQLFRVQRAIDDWFQTADVQPGQPLAAALPVRRLQRVSDRDNGAWNPRLISYSTTLQTTTIIVEADQSGFVQLAVPWFPGNKVHVNGAESDVGPLQGTLGLMVLPVDAGRSVIEIAPVTTTIRRFALLVTLGAVLATLLIALWLRRGDRRAVVVA